MSLNILVSNAAAHFLFQQSTFKYLPLFLNWQSVGFRWGRKFTCNVIWINFVLSKFSTDCRLNRTKKDGSKKAEDIKPTGTSFVNKKCLDGNTRGTPTHPFTCTRNTLARFNSFTI